MYAEVTDIKAKSKNGNYLLTFQVNEKGRFVSITNRNSGQTMEMSDEDFDELGGLLYAMKPYVIKPRPIPANLCCGGAEDDVHMC